MVAYPLNLQATTATLNPSGFVLGNSTPTILIWNVPNDGQQHRVIAFAAEYCTSAMTGGQINFNYTLPDGQTQSWDLMSGGQSSNQGNYANSIPAIVEPGSTVTIVQQSAMSAGACTMWAEIWGN